MQVYSRLIALVGVLHLGCNSAPVEPADREGISTPADNRSSALFRSTAARATVIIRNNGCSVFNGEGELVPADRDFTIATQSTRFNTTTICKVKNLATAAGRAVSYDSEHNPFGPGVLCGILRPDGFFVTTAWTETLSQSGNATLRCHLKL